MRGNLPQKITAEEIRQCPLFSYQGNVTIVQSIEDAHQAITELSEYSVLGFDTETRPVFKKGRSNPTSLIQLAGEKGVYLFQLNKIQTIEPLLPLFENAEIVKTGIGIADDIKGLQQLHPFQAQGFFDSASLSSSLGIINTGLRPLVALFLEKRISKGAQTSNWAANQLRVNQIRYAATDAWVSRELYCKLRTLV